MRNIDGRVPCQTGSAGREPSTDPTSQKFIEALGSFLQMTACGSVAASVMSHFDDLSQPAMPEILLNAGLVSTGFRRRTSELIASKRVTEHEMKSQ
ncbi:MAG: hypothetical protein K2Z81_21005 [Cyanobacteria bacterium]|nr:hypothetical protein [Cyanobacteriota bacterium]